MRQIEAEINTRRGEEGRKSDIPLTNFRGIELRSFPAEIARLALIIAEYQSDVQYRGQRQALAEFLPLDAMNWITCGNALRLDWLSLCPPTGSAVKMVANDLFHTPLDQPEIDFENEGGETYICGNPPYLGSTWQSAEQKADLESVFAGRTRSWKSLDYVTGWFMKAADYGTKTDAATAFVATNSICQGQQVPILWPLIFDTDHEINFAHTSFKWANLASYNAGVTVIIVGISRDAGPIRRLYSESNEPSGGSLEMKEVDNINPYLVSGPNLELSKSRIPLTAVSAMDRGSSAVDGGHLFLDNADLRQLRVESPDAVAKYIRRYLGSEELINGKNRYCLWIDNDESETSKSISFIKNRLKNVTRMRLSSKKSQTNIAAKWPHKFGEIRHQNSTYTIVVP